MQLLYEKLLLHVRQQQTKGLRDTRLCMHATQAHEGSQHSCCK
jgi:hypothetical protein